MSDEFAEGAVCMPNIGPRERAKRMRFGVVSGVVAAATAAGTIAAGAPAVARALVFLPALMAGYGVFQAREKT
jgi:hypothetical protein